MRIGEEVYKGDSLELLSEMEQESVSMIYMDPPFFTGKKHKSKNRDRTKEFIFDDLWLNYEEYSEFLYHILVECRRVLKQNGSIFVHCDANANHVVRAVLDEVFGFRSFRSEIIWTYKRWSNSKKGLLPAHQTIYWYSKSNDFTFNRIWQSYSESTNVDQILQKRSRDEDGKSVYAKDGNGDVVLDDEKKGVPLSDVWEIPYLNPKAKERVGYPTQKPLLLLERIVSISTNPDDIVLDPFCGSGTTLVAAKLTGRKGIGIDISNDAIELTRDRMENPVKTESALLAKGRSSYRSADENAMALLQGLDVIPVHRNKGIDGILKTSFDGGPILIRVQKIGESLPEAASRLADAANTKKASLSILVRTNQTDNLFEEALPAEIQVIDAPDYQVHQLLRQLTSPSSTSTKN